MTVFTGRFNTVAATTTMCEIATIPVAEVDSDSDNRHERISSLVELSQMFYDSNPHGLGVVATTRDESAGAFEHQAFKTGWTEQGMSATALYEFVDEQIDDAWRITVHARYATAGNVDRDGTHPIIIRECDETPWKAVVHNGSVRGHQYKRRRLERDGHTFSTEVDSEVIAHETALPDPDTFGSDDDEWDVPNLRGNLNYLLFHEDMILAYTEGKYHVTDDFTMACNHRDYNTDKPTQGEEGWFLFTPDGEVSFREMEKPPSKLAGRSTTVQSGVSRKTNPWKGYRNRSWSADGSSSAQSRLDDAHDSSTSDDDSDDDARSGDSGNLNRADGVRSPRSYESDSAADKTRETLLTAHYESNPNLGADGALDQSEHAGYFVGADRLFCLEHDRPFTFMCTDCKSEMQDSPNHTGEVGLTFQPDIFPGAQHNIAQVNTANGTRTVTRCPTTSEWYVGEECPTCGVAHDTELAHPY